MIQFETRVLIDRPVEAVFAFLADPMNLPRWQSQIVEVKPQSRARPGKGSTFVVVGEMLGRRIEGSLEIVELRPATRLSQRIHAGPMTIQANLALRLAGTGTDLTLQVQGEPAGMLRWATGPLEKQVRKQMEANLARLKSVLEAGA